MCPMRVWHMNPGCAERLLLRQWHAGTNKAVAGGFVGESARFGAVLRRGIALLQIQIQVTSSGAPMPLLKHQPESCVHPRRLARPVEPPGDVFRRQTGP